MKLVSRPLIQVNLGGLASETYNSYSAHSITVATNVTPFPSIHYHHFLHSIASLDFMCKLFISLSITSFYVFLAYLFVGLPQPPKLHIFTKSLSSFLETCPYHRNLFLCMTVAMSTAALIQCKIAYPLISHHTFI